MRFLYLELNSPIFSAFLLLLFETFSKGFSKNSKPGSKPPKENCYNYILI